MRVKASKRAPNTRKKAGTKVMPSRGGTARRTVMKGRKCKPAKKLAFDAFADGYLDAAIFADLPEGCDGSLDIFPGCFPQILKDCHRFQRQNRRLLDRIYNEHGYSATAAGQDFWYSRQGHAIGFAYRDLGDAGDRLQEAASEFGSVDVLPGTAPDGEEYIFIE
ncbi:hypothetical protein XH90_09320 [Bradyrhizobium sp. CCBAU 53338]|nr:hypothetical protein XH90_09320 [Bradyrhizobium sp. CCBAU 53338]